MLGPAHPGFSSDFLTFFQPTLYGTTAGFGNIYPNSKAKIDKKNINHRAQVQLDFWGRIFSGNYHFELGSNRYINSRLYKTPILYYEGNWDKLGSLMSATFGDQSIGLSEVIFPIVPLRGAVFTLSGIEHYGADQPHSRYAPAYQTIEGFAPANSNAQLYINGRMVNEQKTRPDPEAPVGQAIYRWFIEEKASSSGRAENPRSERFLAGSNQTSVQKNRSS